jgi:hypothetical protein
MKSKLETYKCAVLTVIAVLLAAILWHMPSKPLTLGQVRAAKAKGVPAVREIMNRVPLVYVQDGSISVDNFENPLPVEVQNQVEVEVDH